MLSAGSDWWMKPNIFLSSILPQFTHHLPLYCYPCLHHTDAHIWYDCHANQPFQPLTPGQHGRLNTLRPGQNGRLFTDDTFKCIFLNENIRISTKNSLKFVPKGLINNIPALVLIMAWRRPGDKPLSEPMMVRLPTHICVARPQWVNVWMSAITSTMETNGCNTHHICITTAALFLEHFDIKCTHSTINGTRIYDIKNNAWVTVNNDFLSRVRRFDNDFHEWLSHEWKSLPNRLTGDKKSLFTVTNVLFYFLHAILCHEHTNPLKTIIERPFRHCCQGWHFLTQHCDVTTIHLWRHANARNWHCDVIFVDCHCTRKLAQRRSSLVNNNREYRYPATRYSRLSV